MQNKIIKSILPSVFAIMVLTIIGCSIQNTVLAQSNSNDSSGNQTRAEITGKPETTIINKTTIPAQQTTVTVNKTTSSLDQAALQPLQNQTMAQAPVDLSAFKNKTILQPTGEAQTTMLNKTTYLLNKQQSEVLTRHKHNNKDKVIKQEHNNKVDNNNKVPAMYLLMQVNQQTIQVKQFKEMQVKLEQRLVKEHKN